MTKFEDAVIAIDDSHTGKIDWDAAYYLWGLTANYRDAAIKYINSRKGK